MVNENINAGETVLAVLRNAETGEKRTIEQPRAESSEPTQKIEVIITDLQTGRVQHFEVKR